jgi:transposase
MIQVTPQMRILVAVEPVDFRKGIDGLAGICKRLQLDPFNGYLFVFRNKSGMSIKIISYDGQGYWICQKRLSKGRFRWWPEVGTTTRLAADEIQALLWNKDPGKALLWKPLK